MHPLRLRVITTTSFFAFAFLAFAAIPAKAADIWYAHFENQDFHGSPTDALCCKHSAQIINSIVLSGKYAVRFILNSDDNKLTGNVEPVRKAMIGKNNTASIGSTRWYGMGVNIDPSWRDDTNDPNGTIVFQWKSNPDAGEEASRSPQLAIMVHKDEWKISNLSDPNRITTNSSFKRINWKGGVIEKGKWVDWVVYAKWSYKSDGVLKVWKNGTLMIDHRGPNTFNDEKPEYIRFGVYKAWWKHQLPPTRNTLTVYFDEVRIGDQNSSYQNVAPKRSQSGIVSAPENLKVVDQ
jgi:hypothetical protein